MLSVDKLRSNYQSIGFFGLGFIQLKINNINRYHFYSPSLLGTVDDQSAHNHRYNFISLIEKGELEQSFFNLTDGMTHHLTDESCIPNQTQPQTKRLVSLQKTRTLRVQEGSQYEMHFEQFHRVYPVTCNTITFLTRDSFYRQQFAQVATPVGAPEVCPFESPYSEDDLWELVQEIIVN